MEHIPQYLVLKDPVDLLRKAVSVYAKNWRPLVLITLIPVLFSLGIVDFSRLDINDPNTIFLIIISSIFTVISVVLSIVSMSATIKAVSLASKDKNVDITAAYVFGFKKFWGFLAVTLLSVITVIGGGILFLIPGLILNIFLTFSTFIYVNEKVTPLQAIYDSFTLVFKRGWRTFMRILFLAVIAISAMIFVDLVFEGIRFMLVPILGGVPIIIIKAVIDIVTVIILNSVIMPVAVSYLNALYVDLKDSEPKHNKDQINRLELTLQLFFALGVISIVTFLVMRVILMYN